MDVAEDEARRLELGCLGLYTNEVTTENLAIYRHLGYRGIDRHSKDGYAGCSWKDPRSMTLRLAESRRGSEVTSARPPTEVYSDRRLPCGASRQELRLRSAGELWLDMQSVGLAGSTLPWC